MSMIRHSLLVAKSSSDVGDPPWFTQAPSSNVKWGQAGDFQGLV